MRSATGFLSSSLLMAGLICVLVGEKVLDYHSSSSLMAVLALVLFALSLMLRATQWNAARKHSLAGPIRVQLYFLLSQIITVAAVGLYFLIDATVGPTINPEKNPTLFGLIRVSWPAVVAIGLLPLSFMESAWQRMPVQQDYEDRRVSRVGLRGLGVSLILIFAVATAYATTKRDIEKDVSYFKTTEPSEGTVALTKSTSDPLAVKLIFPAINPVLNQIQPYFRKLESENKAFKVDVVDHALLPDLTKKFRIRENGTILLLRGKGESQQGEKLKVGTELLAARSTLKKLDGKFREKLARLVSVRREIYVTHGHGERSRLGEKNDDEKIRTKFFDEVLKQNNFARRKLGMRQGLSDAVPEGAPMVAVLGPRTGFLDSEARSLLQYVERGGKLLLLAEGNESHGLTPLFDGLGIQLGATPLAASNPAISMTRTNADRGIILGMKYSSHPAVGRLSQLSGRVPTLFYHATSIETKKNKRADRTIAFPITRKEGLFEDRNGDFIQNEDEKSVSANLMATIEVKTNQKNGRVVVISDGDFFSDGWLADRRFGNSEVFLATIQWLIGNEEVVSAPTSEEDIPIQTSTEETKLWFWATSVGIPLIPLAMGTWVFIRRNRKRRFERDGVN